MAKLLYLTGIYGYQFLIWLVSPFNRKAEQWRTGRKNWQTHLQTLLATNTAPIAWFHAASLGEFEQGRPVMESFRARYPHYKILLTFFSPSGYEVRKNYDGADYILYLPADTPANARQFVDTVKPAIAFFIKYEFWHYYLSTLKDRHVPVISVSALFRPGQVFFRWYGGFYRNILHQFAHLLVQNQESIELLTSIGITAVTRAGDTRFDRVKQVVDTIRDIPIAAAFKNQPGTPNPPLFVIGSAWQADMTLLIPFFNRFDHPLQALIAPHEIHDEEIERWRTQLNAPSIRYSALSKQGNSIPPNQPPARYLFIDNIGMLSSLYQYGTFAYVGGGFGSGLHNILEAATFGLPLFFGPDYARFPEAVDLVREGAAFSVADTDALASAVLQLYNDPEAYKKAAQISRDYVLRNIGATAKVMSVVRLYLQEAATGPR